MEWFEKEEDELTRQVNSGEISERDYHIQMADLYEEVRRQEAEDAAQDAYDRHMGFSY